MYSNYEILCFLIEEWRFDKGKEILEENPLQNKEK